jgi:hypothetical protein
VLASLAEVAVPLVSEDAWFGGQKHVVPLLELCLPGIDLVCLPLQLSRMPLTYHNRMTQSRPSQLLDSSRVSL